MALTPDINATEKWLIEHALKGFCGGKGDYRLADAKVRLQPSDREPCRCV
jgi:hypothetical protein